MFSQKKPAVVIKISVLIAILLISITSMSFRSCSNYQFPPETPPQNSESSEYNSGDNSVSIKYSIYVGANGYILRSEGESNIVFEQKVSGTTQNLNRVRVTPQLSSGSAIAVGNNGTICVGGFTGGSWSLAAPVTSSNLYGIDLLSLNCFAAGDNGTILVSTNSGVNWIQVPSGSTKNLKAIGINPSATSVIVAVGEKGTILRSSNNGANWTNVSISDTTVNFYDISKRGRYYTSFYMIAVGSGGKIYKSVDNGLTWLPKTSGTTSTLRNIYYHNTDSAVVVGDNGVIRLTTNKGETWYTDGALESPATRNYKSAMLINRDKKKFAALSDTIFFISNDLITVGLDPVNTAISQKTSLGQNYPNPFNPATKIGFDLPKGSFAKLSVYDITGREIKTLVNENLHAGVYEYEWNAVNLPSGVYFYKLETGNFTQTKRMILVK